MIELKMEGCSEDYRELNEAYVRRQVLVYTHWPQFRMGPLGYEDEKVFIDQNS